MLIIDFETDRFKTRDIYLFLEKFLKHKTDVTFPMSLHFTEIVISFIYNIELLLLQIPEYVGQQWKESIHSQYPFISNLLTNSLHFRFTINSKIFNIHDTSAGDSFDE